MAVATAKPKYRWRLRPKCADHVENGVVYKAGEIIETDRDLGTLFKMKFKRVLTRKMIEDEDDEEDEEEFQEVAPVLDEEEGEEIKDEEEEVLPPKKAKGRPKKVEETKETPAGVQDVTNLFPIARQIDCVVLLADKDNLYRICKDEKPLTSVTKAPLEKDQVLPHLRKMKKKLGG